MDRPAAASTDQAPGHRLWAVGWWAATLAASAVVVYVFVTNPGISSHAPARVSKLVHGTADQPYVGRALVPLCVRGLAALVPRSVDDALNRAIADSLRVREFFNRWGWEVGYGTEYALTVALIYASLVGYVLAMRRLFRTVTSASATTAGLVALLSLAALPAMFRYVSYIYDLTTLFLATLCFGLLAARRWPAYCAAFLLACINKETALLFTLVFAIHFRRHPALPRRTYLTLIGVQAAAWLVIRGAIAVAFRDNPGGPLLFTLRHNFYLLEPVAPSLVAAWVVLAAAVFHRFAEKPRLLRNGLWLFAAQFVLGIFMGYLDEYRIYYESFPVFVGLAGLTGAWIVGVPGIRAVTG